MDMISGEVDMDSLLGQGTRVQFMMLAKVPGALKKTLLFNL